MTYFGKLKADSPGTLICNQDADRNADRWNRTTVTVDGKPRTIEWRGEKPRRLDQDFNYAITIKDSDKEYYTQLDAKQRGPINIFSGDRFQSSLYKGEVNTATNRCGFDDPAEPTKEDFATAARFFSALRSSPDFQTAMKSEGVNPNFMVYPDSAVYREQIRAEKSQSAPSTPR